MELCADCGGRDIRRSQDETERDELWKARHELYYASCALKTNGRAIVTDACVPVSQLPGLIQATSRDVKEHGVVGPCVEIKILRRVVDLHAIDATYTRHTG